MFTFKWNVNFLDNAIVPPQLIPWPVWKTSTKIYKLCFLNWLLDLQKYLKIYTGSFFYWFPIFFEESVSQKENFCGKSSRMGPPLKVLKSSESGVKTSYSFYAAFFGNKKHPVQYLPYHLQSTNVLSQYHSRPESLFTDIARQRDSLQVVCFNVVSYGNSSSLFSTHFTNVSLRPCRAWGG